jgi:hypothetical protein
MTDTKLKQIGPDTGQLSQNLSFIEKTQIGAIKNTGVSITATPGKINGSVSTALSNINNSARSTMEIGAGLAQNLESAGAVRKNSREFIGSVIPKVIQDKNAIHNVENKFRNNIANSTNRPLSKRKSADEVIKKNKNDIVGQALEELGLLDLSYAGLQFPNDLDTYAPVWLTLQFAKYSRTNPFAPGSVGGYTNIHLPLPENFSFTSSIRLDDSDTGVHGQLLKMIEPSDASTDAGREGIVNKVKSAVSQGAISDVMGRAAFAALDSVDPIAGGLAGQIIGGIPNPHPSVFFKGMDLRTFQWNWKLVARSTEDANMIKAILTVLRAFTIPQDNNGFLEYPFLVKPKINGDGDTWMYGTFKRAMVSQLSINFSAEGSSAYFVDGNPVSINLGLNFQEVETYNGQ